MAATTWQTLESRLAHAHPALLARLPAPATSRALDEVEVEIGVELPALVRAIYLLHDGIGMPGVRDRVTRHSFLLSLADAMDAWRMLRDGLRSGWFDDTRVTLVDEGVRPRWWHERWFPISSTGSGDHHCVDMDPAGTGHVGQIIAFWHDDGDRCVRARDLADYLVDEVDAVEWAMVEGLLPSPPGEQPA
jgi:cell wall assembly regulator SMI1